MAANPSSADLELTPLDQLQQLVPPAGAEQIRLLALRAAQVLNAATEAALQPALKKTLRRWNQGQTADILGVSRKTLDRWVDERNPDGTVKVPQGTREGRGARWFTLEEIHQIQGIKGIRRWRDERDPCLVLAISNFKGGVGKSTTAVPVAQWFARQGYRVLLVDSDPQGSCTTAFGLRPDQDIEEEKTLGPWLFGEVASPDTWTGTLATAVQKTYWDGLDLIASNLHLYGAEFGLASRRLKDPSFLFYRVLHEGLEPLKKDYDLIVIDTPPSLSYLTTNALFAADGVIMPVPPAMMDFASSVSFFKLLTDLINTVDEIEPTPKTFRFLAALVTKVEPGKAEQVAIEEWLREAFPKRVLKATVGQSAAIRLAADIQTPYEIERYDGDRRTLKRAIEYLDAVNLEIERLVRAHWPHTRAKERRA